MRSRKGSWWQRLLGLGPSPAPLPRPTQPTLTVTVKEWSGVYTSTMLWSREGAKVHVVCDFLDLREASGKKYDLVVDGLPVTRDTFLKFEESSSHHLVITERRDP